MPTMKKNCVLQPEGVLTAHNAKDLMATFEKCFEAKERAILVDMEHVQFVDSSGLGILISMHTRLKLAGGRLYLCSLNEQAKGILDISDLDQVFRVVESPSEFFAVAVP